MQRVSLRMALLLQIVYCARAKASTLGDAKIVEETGPAMLARELQVGDAVFASAMSCKASLSIYERFYPYHPDSLCNRRAEKHLPCRMPGTG